MNPSTVHPSITREEAIDQIDRLHAELAGVKATRERFRIRFREAEDRIAKARRLIRRAHLTSPEVDAVYAALGRLP